MSGTEHSEGDEPVEPVEVDGADGSDSVEGADDADGADGADGVEDPGDGREGLDSIPASDELAAALKEAEESFDERHAKREADDTTASDASPSNSADKMTIELLAEELQSLKGEHDKALATLSETEDKQLRLHAEFDNFRRRTLKEKQDTFKYGVQNIVKDLLATVDNLERAVAHGEESKDEDFESLLQGVELVRGELLATLSKHGVDLIDAENKLFDPAMHEAMAQVATADVPENTVLQVLQAGYMLRDRMLRPARVVVSKAAEDEAASETTQVQDESQQTQDDASQDEES